VSPVKTGIRPSKNQRFEGPQKASDVIPSPTTTREMIMQPKFILADEPTGHLDSSNSKIVMDLLKQIVDEHKTTVVYVTHDSDYSAMANRKIELIDGRLVE